MTFHSDIVQFLPMRLDTVQGLAGRIYRIECH